MWLASLFEEIAWAIADVGWLFWDIGSWFYSWTGSSTIRRHFQDVAVFIGDVSEWFFEVSYEVEDWYDWISGIWDDLTTVWDYVYGLLTQRAYEAWTWALDALDQAAEALSKAQDALDYAYGWLTDQVNAAWDKAVWAYEQIEVLVTAAASDIYAWVRSIPAEISAWVLARIDEVKTWATGAIEDARSSVLAQIAAPINLVNLWFADIQDFFNDPADFFLKKIEKLGVTFAEKLWKVFETVLEKVW